MRLRLIIAVAVYCFVTNLVVNGQSPSIPVGYFSGISKVEIEMLMSDVAKSNPVILERLAKDPEMKKAQLENLRELLAFATYAQQNGLASEPINRQELENIRDQTVAVNYDKELNKGKPSKELFGYITDQQVAAFWSSGRNREAQFDSFLNAKLEILRSGDSQIKVSAEERSQARDVFAKTQIYKTEYENKAKARLLPKGFIDRSNLQVKLQLAQFLAKLSSERMAAKIAVNDAEIAKYIADHAELDPAAKRAKAQSVLNRAKAGESFAALANEFSEDPGNSGGNGEKLGGIYTDIPLGRMVVPFERAALSLEPGQVSSDLVETDFGFHVIKLEKKGLSKDPASIGTQTYDARHILISTTIEDPGNPSGRPVPVKDYVREKIESAKQKQIVDRVVAENNIQVPADFDIPKATVEAEAKPVTKRPASKKRPVKKRK